MIILVSGRRPFENTYTGIALVGIVESELNIYFMIMVLLYTMN